jgi:hypothetical protein
MRTAEEGALVQNSCLLIYWYYFYVDLSFSIGEDKIDPSTVKAVAIILKVWQKVKAKQPTHSERHWLQRPSKQQRKQYDLQQQSVPP